MSHAHVEVARSIKNAVGKIEDMTKELSTGVYAIIISNKTYCKSKKVMIQN